MPFILDPVQEADFFFFFVRNMADLSVDLLTQHRNKLTVTVLLHLPFFHVLLLSSMF